MAASDARPFPLKNTAYRVTFPILDADGDLVTGAASLDSEVSKDGGTFADCTNEATEIATSSGMYYLDLTSTEMNADTVAIIVKTGTSGAKTTTIVLYPVEGGDIDVDVTYINGSAVSTSTAQLGVNVVQISEDATAANNAESFFDGTGYAGTNNTIPTVTNVTNAVSANVTQISGDSTAADNAESFFDGTGYAGTNNTIPTVTNVTTVNGLAANVITASSIAADAIGASELAADAATEIGTAVWATAARTLTAATNITSTGAAVPITAGGYVSADVTAISTDTTAADNAESFFDGTGYAGTNNVIPTVTAVGSVSGAVGSVTGNVGGNVTGSVGSLAAQAKADVNAEVLDVLATDTFAEPGSVPAATSSIKDKIGFIFTAMRNKRLTTETTDTIRNDADSAAIGASSLSDDGTTFTRGEYA